ncbi:uncharacterized protein LOC111864374 [Cryptotermes secundus]|uniref:uncharacterized protein LOC111864374 n=1 Tax=Cryptotermes secundus TaxID=105785 RepID=UPI001454C82A|nr:uncharacterized protein LOC111864374 [Cryptotermes secundus]
MATRKQFILTSLIMLASKMIGCGICQMDDSELLVLSRKVRYALFPDASTMGLYLAVAVPLEDASYSVSLSWNFEANYQLPSNYTELILPFVLAGASRSERQFSRRNAYQMVEKRFRSYGLKGRECLLRTICEAAESPLRHNGLMGDILHIIFTVTSVALLSVKITCQLDEHTDFAVLSRKLRYIFFPEGSVMGMVLAASIPLQSNKELSETWFMEAAYHLPEFPFNASDILDSVMSYRISRDLNRTGLYHMLEKTFHRFGFDGRECLLRTICEVTGNSLYENKQNGLLGDLVHIIFTPSSSLDETLPLPFNTAEQLGTNGEDCQLAYSKCSFGLLDAITTHRD